jgi:hypothetical protein
MGIYINPKDRSKEEWLTANAVTISNNAPPTFREGDNIVVCLVDNGGFTAAAVAYSQRELQTFKREDGRPKLWCQVPIAKLSTVLEFDLEKEMGEME